MIKNYGFLLGSYFRELSTTPIRNLYFIGCPSTITFLVISIIIYAINGSLLLSILLAVNYITWVHIIFKVYKRHPAWTDSNTPTAPISKLVMVLVKTPSNNVFPRFVNSGSTHPMFSQQISPKTTTGFSISARQVVRTFNNYLPTIAFTFPQSIFMDTTSYDT